MAFGARVLPSLFVLASAACQWVVRLDASKSEAASDAGVDDASPAPVFFPCDDIDRYRPPSGELNEGAVEINLATSTLTYISSDKPRPDLCPNVGFNLDRKRTCYDDAGARRAFSECPGDLISCAWGPTCTNAGSTKEENVCDESDGTDNGFGRLLSADNLGVLTTTSLSKLNIERVIRAGTGNVLLRITGYNGEANDPSIGLAILASAGVAQKTSSLEEAGTGLSSDMTWDGGTLREWYVAEDTVRPGTDSPVTTARGYVVDHVLVADIEDGLPSTTYGFKVKYARFTGLLRKRGDYWEIAYGRMGGRADLTEVLRGLSEFVFQQGGTDVTICDRTDLFSFAHQLICAYADAVPPDVGSRCTELTIGFGFTAAPAIIGPIRSRPTTTKPCDRSDEEMKCQ
jgi:hypothetical protein